MTIYEGRASRSLVDASPRDDRGGVSVGAGGDTCGGLARGGALETGSADREANMRRFGAELLRLLIGALEG